MLVLSFIFYRGIIRGKCLYDTDPVENLDSYTAVNKPVKEKH